MPTRSAGCFACRRRKIGCDQTKPGCKKCDIHGIPCPGYRSDSDKSLNVVIYQASPQIDHRHPTKTPRPNHAIPARKESSSSTGSSSSETLGSDTTASSVASPTLLHEISCVPQNRLQAVSVAMSKLVPAGESVDTALDLMNIAPFYFMQIRQPVLVAAMDTLALVQLGTSYKDQGVLVQAQRSYGKCLLLLLQTISSMPEGIAWDEQVASAVLVIALAGVSLAMQHLSESVTDCFVGFRYPPPSPEPSQTRPGTTTASRGSRTEAAGKSIRSNGLPSSTADHGMCPHPHRQDPPLTSSRSTTAAHYSKSASSKNPHGSRSLRPHLDGMTPGNSSISQSDGLGSWRTRSQP